MGPRGCDASVVRIEHEGEGHHIHPRWLPQRRRHQVGDLLDHLEVAGHVGISTAANDEA